MRVFGIEIIRMFYYLWVSRGTCPWFYPGDGKELAAQTESEHAGMVGTVNSLK